MKIYSVNGKLGDIYLGLTEDYELGDNSIVSGMMTIVKDKKEVASFGLMSDDTMLDLSYKLDTLRMDKKIDGFSMVSNSFHYTVYYYDEMPNSDKIKAVVIENDFIDSNYQCGCLFFYNDDKNTIEDVVKNLYISDIKTMPESHFESYNDDEEFTISPTEEDSTEDYIDETTEEETTEEETYTPAELETTEYDPENDIMLKDEFTLTVDPYDFEFYTADKDFPLGTFKVYSKGTGKLILSDDDFTVDADHVLDGETIEVKEYDSIMLDAYGEGFEVKFVKVK